MSNKGKACESVRVVVRCRPPSNKEASAEKENSVMEVDTELGRIFVLNPSATPGEPAKQFTFHSVFGWESTQCEVYDDAVRPVVDSVLLGFNGTVFAYGQTGTGKTWTMRGVPADPEKRGVIPNAFHHIFAHISRTRGEKYLVRSSYLEIYQEEIRDLLMENGRKLELKESPEEGVYVKDLSWVVTKDPAEMHHLLTLGDRSRCVASTNANRRSSRSHAIFAVTVECGSESEEPVRVGRLNMVDLAGSERQSRTGAQGGRLREAAKINLSLSALGNVISALADGKGGHVPYRDSKLTRLLRDSLGGNAKTLMIATVGPSERDRHESLATLRYAGRAKNIKNKPRVNEDREAALLRDFQREIARLKGLLEERGALARERRQKRRDSKRLSRDLPQNWNEEHNEEVKWHRSNGNMDDGGWDREAVEKIIEKYKAMESKLLEGGKTIIDHTNEQQKLLEQKRQEIADQIRREREIQQQMMLQDEETLEMRETFSSMQQEVEMKTKKLRKLYTKLQLVWAEMRDALDEHVATRQELEETQNELTRELKYKSLLMENFVPPAEKKKIINRLNFDSEEDQWKLMSVIPSESAPTRVKRRPLSSMGYKRPISQYAQAAVATATGTSSRYQAENIMLLELDVSPPTMLSLNLDGAHLERAFSPILMSGPQPDIVMRERTGSSARVRKSRSWYQAPQAVCLSTSTSFATLRSPSQSPCGKPRPASATYIVPEASFETSP
ncbi:kinesin-like protein KIF3C [Corythoichthys intestinalis]|uniref:kinesin-like protein KIF3C n=1 Tax=Corythoichthys intestinalis TaxID=161448 RepID=UPI0025A62712|nr:kinesin-like protein KIF3C [Corythoichthys intestinalis]XP_061798506.1 kinesin-like protein KIF3C [Nerophis lumbriciformis]